MTSMSPPPAPGSFDLETVKVWYSCKSQNQCSSWFYSVPALQKHFMEKHPDEELKLPDNLDPGALEGRIIFEENFSKKLPGCHKNCTKIRVGGAPPPPMQSPALVNNKKYCTFCPRSYPSQEILNFHLKKDHHFGCTSAADTGVEPLSSDHSDEKTPEERQLIKLNNAVPSTSQGHSQSNSSKVIKAKPYSWSPLKLPSAQLRPFRCDCCSKTFRTSGNLKSHLVIHSDERLKCSICGYTTRWKANLARHVSSVHNSTSKVSKTTQKNQLIKRKLTTKPRVSRKVILSCGDCPYKTKIAQRFENHCRLHELGADAVACHICGWFLRPSFVGLHQARCHSEAVNKVADK
ncbi:putative zinc finger protein [Orchesella cincta]|uniref:Putative zinc finger protein n=1 Tax=Orchesella cincta TaxID=48709 RepID=A0A1D2M4V1_ORCCI|nr:putative zinc finger protein [Orchesella cincta]